MNLKGLVHREIGEGLTGEELASVIGVSERTIADILVDELPQDPAIWEKFALYFRTDAELLQSGGPPHPEGLFDRTEGAHPSPLGEMRKVPLLREDQIEQMVTSKEPPRLVHAETLLETDVPGKRTFAMQVRDNSMQPLFSKDEIIFVDPDLPAEPGHYVVVEHEGDGCAEALVRQLKEIGGEAVLHPLNSTYEDLPVTKQQRIFGRVVRLRKDI